jgi:hypothetical protein
VPPSVWGGDEIAYRIEGDHVILTKAKREPVDDLFAPFHEWSSEADRRAYGDLEVWDIIKVPFPYPDRPVRQRRPALVVAADEIEATHGVL